MKNKWFCAQIGAREHYSVPRVLWQDGRLAGFYTDFWAGSLIRGIASKSDIKKFRSLATRFHPELAQAPIISWNTRSLAWEAGLWHQKLDHRYEDFINIGASFACCVCEALKRRQDLDSDSIFFAYDTGALEAMEGCWERGIKCILNQMDPNRVEVAMVQEEEKRWPNWSICPLEVPEEYFRRREKEWALADRVVVNSDFCREALVKQGVPEEKLAVIPLCYEAEDRGQKSEVRGRRTAGSREQGAGSVLRVLFLGQVILRKGIQYLTQAAKLLQNEPIQFDVVGPIGISKAGVASAPRNVTFHGRATRDQAAEWYRQSDLFVLPTLSDGFALTQLEAMSYGLPVVATPCCGAVVSDGIDGFIVPPRDSGALAQVLQRYVSDPKLIKDQSNAALSKVKQFTLDHLAQNLRTLEQWLPAPC